MTEPLLHPCGSCRNFIPNCRLKPTPLLIKPYLEGVWHILIHQVFELLLAQSVWISLLLRVLVEDFDDALYTLFHL